VSNMEPTWNSRLATGLAWMDEEHQELCRQVDLLVEAARKHQPGTGVQQMLTFLEQYVNKHFGHEEAAMKEANLPESLHHIQAHRQFTANLMEWNGVIERKGATHVTLMQLYVWVRQWLLAHIMSVDARMAREYLAACDRADSSRPS
jgi:hemerythrin-like metal-binding protein